MWRKQELGRKKEMVKVPPCREEMDQVFRWCRQGNWKAVRNAIAYNSLVATTNMIMGNNISTTVLHQAITSKSEDEEARKNLILDVLEIAPEAARIRNGYGSLPLHVICQRNTKFDSEKAKIVIRALMNSYEGALIQPGGVGRRTPIHIIFTDYVCGNLVREMIERGKEACFMKDRDGELPAHVGCGRHISPAKLQMLLRVNPKALTERNNNGATLLYLAIVTATRQHPNNALKADLRNRLRQAGYSPAAFSPEDMNLYVSYDSSRKNDRENEVSMKNAKRPRRNWSRKRKMPATVSSEGSNEDSDDSVKKIAATTFNPTHVRARKVTEDDDANLLLHFSRHKDEKVSGDSSSKEVAI